MHPNLHLYQPGVLSFTIHHDIFTLDRKVSHRKSIFVVDLDELSIKLFKLLKEAKHNNHTKEIKNDSKD